MAPLRQISYAHAGGLNLLPAILIDPRVEEIARKAIRQTSSRAFLALDPETSKAIVSGVQAAFQKYQGQRARPVLMASLDIRRYVRRLIEGECFELPVLS